MAYNLKNTLPIGSCISLYHEKIVILPHKCYAINDKTYKKSLVS